MCAVERWTLPTTWKDEDFSTLLNNAVTSVFQNWQIISPFLAFAGTDPRRKLFPRNKRGLDGVLAGLTRGLAVGCGAPGGLEENRVVKSRSENRCYSYEEHCEKGASHRHGYESWRYGPSFVKASGLHCYPRYPLGLALYQSHPLDPHYLLAISVAIDLIVVSASSLDSTSCPNL